MSDSRDLLLKQKQAPSRVPSGGSQISYLLWVSGILFIIFVGIIPRLKWRLMHSFRTQSQTLGLSFSKDGRIA